MLQFTGDQSRISARCQFFQNINLNVVRQRQALAHFFKRLLRTQVRTDQNAVNFDATAIQPGSHMY